MVSPRRLAVLFLFLLCPTAGADVNIAPACRMKNRPPGRCGWCALETLARHHHIEAMYGFTERHACTCSARTLEDSLSQTGVRYRIQYAGSSSQEILKYAVRHGLGAAVGLLERSTEAEGHMVTLVGFSAHAVKIIDPNDADGRTRRLPLQQFLSSWDGFAVVLLPEVRWTRAQGASVPERAAQASSVRSRTVAARQEGPDGFRLASKRASRLCSLAHGSHRRASEEASPCRNRNRPDPSAPPMPFSSACGGEPLAWDCS